MPTTIFSWKCSHYDNSTRKWTNGNLSLRENDLVFTEDGNNVNKTTEKPLKFFIEFSDICEVKKATSTLIYRCLVFNIKSECLWFSSFLNLDDVLRTIEYFWKEKLCTSLQPSSSYDRQRANELVKIVHSTQDTLMESSKTLHVQGKQINNAAVTMNMVHNDLTVAERISDDLDSYFCSWRIKSPPPKVPNLVIERNDNSDRTDRIEYSILYATLSQESHKPGYMVLKNATIDILNEKSVSIFASPVAHLSNIEVNSPWDIDITKRLLGKSDVHWHLISMRMPELIQTLRKVYDIELCYAEPPDVDDDDNENSDTDLEHSRNSLLDRSSSETNAGGAQTQLSNEDSAELSKVLNNIKSMAVNIGVEQEAQLKQLDELNKSVDRADSRIKSTDYKVKKLL